MSSRRVANGVGGVIVLMGGLGIANLARAETQPTVIHEILVGEDSGFVLNATPASRARVVYSTEVQVPDAASIRLVFSNVVLAGDSRSGNGAYVRLQSVKDGAVQTLDARAMEQWREGSAYFNGEAVRVELFAHPGTGPSRLVVERAFVEKALGEGRTNSDAWCAPDPRELSYDPRSARTVRNGTDPNCTAWLINDKNKGFLSAWHCRIRGDIVVQFNVPPSNDDGSLNHPPPEDQYAVDPESIQGDWDWTYFGCFPNPMTGKTPFQAHGAFHRLAASPPPVMGQTIRISGYGSVAPPVSPTWNHVQTTDAGEYLSRSVSSRTYVSPGDSGSAMVDEDSGEAIGILTMFVCGLDAFYFANGTPIDTPGLQHALQNPRGVLVPAFETCYANCNGDDTLDENDFACFQTLFEAGDPSANCDGNINDDYTLRLDKDDYVCFQELFELGCP